MVARRISTKKGKNFLLISVAIASITLFNGHNINAQELPIITDQSVNQTPDPSSLISQIPQLEEALKSNPQDSITRQNLAAAYIQRAANASNSTTSPYLAKNAANDFRKAIFILALDDNATPETANSENTKIAQDNLVSSLRLQSLPTDNASRLKLAKELRGQGKFKEAVVEYYIAGAAKPSPEAFEAIGDIMLAMQKSSRASEYYEKALGMSPEKDRLHLKYAKSLDKAGDYDTAVKEYNLALELNNNDPEIIAALESIWRSKLSQNPDDASAHTNLGVVLQKKGDLDGAFEQYKAAEVIEPNNMTTRLNIGTLLQAKGDFQTALSAYDSILAVDPNIPLVHYYRGQALEKLGDAQGAINEYQATLSIDPSNELAKKELFETVKSSKKTPEEITEFLHQWAENNPNDFLAQYNYAYELHKQKNFPLAEQYYNKAIKIQPEFADAYINLSALYSEMNQPDVAKTVLNDGLKAVPGNGKLTVALQQLQKTQLDKKFVDAAQKQETGKYKEAIEDYLTLIKAGTNTPEVYTGLGAAYQNDDNLKEAINAYNKALQLDSTNTDTLGYLAQAYYDDKQYDKAMAIYQKVLALEPQNEEVKQQLLDIKRVKAEQLEQKALNEYNARRYAKALEYLNAAQTLDGKSAYGFYYKGLVYDALSKYSFAIPQYQKALALDNKLNEANYGLAVDYDLLKRYTEAKASYNKYVAQAQNKNDEYVKYSKQRLKQLQGK